MVDFKLAVADDFREGFSSVAEKISGKWGYIDKTGDYAIKAQFEATLPFSEGMGLVRVGDKWGYINRSGNIVIQPQFDDAKPFSETLAVVRKDRRWVYIDTTGRIVLTPQIDSSDTVPGSFSHGVARIIKKVGTDKGGTTELWGYIDINGRYIWEPTK
jgi:hypothetical protein